MTYSRSASIVRCIPERSKPGPKGPSREVIDAIVAMKERNPRFGCPRIAQQMNLAFGLDFDKDVVRRILAIHYRPEQGTTGPSWLITLGHTKDSLWSLDLFRCESILLKSHWVLLVMDQFTRRIIGFGIHQGDLDEPALCRIFNVAISKQNVPSFLSSDNDPLFFYHRWQANLRILEIDEAKGVPYTPISHPFVKRLIGSIRWEFLDQTFFWTATDLEWKLFGYQQYFNHHRTHSGLDGGIPVCTEAMAMNLNDFRWQRHCRGLFELPLAA